MIVIITKALCYHQVYVADDLYKRYGDSFVFVQMREPLDWRVKCKQEGFERPYLITYPHNPKKVKELIKKTDVLIYGEAPLKLIKLRSKKCLLFRMSENIFKDTQFKIGVFGKIKRFLAYKYLKHLTNNNRSFLLACGGYAYNDYLKVGVFNNRALKWGYFPFIPQITEKEVVSKFDSKIIEMVWISRLIEYKKPLYLLDLVEYLISKGITNFHISVVGDSGESDIDYYQQMKETISDKHLEEYISMIGKVNADKVFDYYKKAQIALFTADKSEGWSVGINEAMSCGCAIVASNGIGAVPFLVNQNNGIIHQYDDVKEMCENVERLLKEPSCIKQLGLNGYKDIAEVWNHENAAKCLGNLIDDFLQSGVINPTSFGPCSKTEKLDYSWYKEK